MILFHEMGHMFHQILGRTIIASFSGAAFALLGGRSGLGFDRGSCLTPPLAGGAPPPRRARLVLPTCPGVLPSALHSLSPKH